MRAYARAVFETLAMDAATVNPYLGSDSVEEFTRYADRGVYVLCRTSNPGAADLQHLEQRWNAAVPACCGNGRALEQRQATSGWSWARRRPTEVAEVRRASDLPFLLPGVGAQGGDVEGAVRAAWNGDRRSRAWSRASRSVLYANEPGREAAALESCRSTRRPGCSDERSASTRRGWC